MCFCCTVPLSPFSPFAPFLLLLLLLPLSPDLLLLLYDIEHSNPRGDTQAWLVTAGWVLPPGRRVNIREGQGEAGRGRSGESQIGDDEERGRSRAVAATRKRLGCTFKFEGLIDCEQTRAHSPADTESNLCVSSARSAGAVLVPTMPIPPHSVF